MRKLIILLVCVFALSACHLFEEKRMSGSVVEYGGRTLTEQELQRLTAGLSSEDSLRVAQQYIRQWAIGMIEYDIAKKHTNKAIEQLVEDYRRSLYLHEYEEMLIAQRMPRIVEDTLIQSFYDLHREHLILPQTIMQGLMLVVPLGAPNMSELRKNLQHPEEEENIEWLEKFAYQYAVGYELFLDEWKTSSDVFVHMPFERDNLDTQLKTKRQIEIQDSVNVYILQVTNLHMKGTLMPLTYARKEIETILLRQRQVDFLQRERDYLYEQAIKTGKLKLYEK